MNIRNRKCLILIVLIILLVLILITATIVACGRKNLKSSEENLQGNYPDYQFENINLLPKSYIYSQKEWISYSEDKEIDIERDMCIDENPIHYKFIIQNGILTVKNMLAQISEEYTFKNIINVKAVMEYTNGQDCGSMDIIILTTDGKIYYRNSSEYISETQSLQLNYSTLESEFKLLEVGYLFDKIGYSTYYSVESRSLGALTSDGKQVTIITYNGTISEPYSSSVYDYLASYLDGKILNIDYTGKMYFEEEKYITDENYNSIYINNGFYSNDAIYIIDREGYLYKISTDGSSTIATKYSNNKVIQYGYDHSKPFSSGIVLLFDNGKSEEFGRGMTKFNLD